MSSFLSNKYLKYRRLLEGGMPKISQDVYCVGCGYNLRGLSPGRNCPECGVMIPFELRAEDPLLSGTMREKAMMMWGLTCMALAAAALVALRVYFAVTWAVPSASVAPLWVYIGLGLAGWSAWFAGACLALPRRLDAVRPTRKWLRRCGRWSQIAWPLAMLLWLLAETHFGVSPTGDMLLAYSLLLRAPGGLGAIALALMLQQMAGDAELDDAPRRIGMAVYVVPVLGLVMLLMPLQANFLILALMSPIVLAWAWYCVHFALGVWEMRQQVAWSMRMAIDMGDREGRIAATRRELDNQARRMVRELPAHGTQRSLNVD